MKRQDCVDAICKKMPELDRKDVERLVKEMANIRSQVFEKGFDEVQGPQFREKAMQVLNDYRFNQQQRIREAGENLLKKHKLNTFVMQDAFKQDPVEAVKALLGGTARISEGGNFSVDAMQVGLKAKLHSMLWGGLKDAGVDEIARKGLLDRETAQALWELGKGKDGEPRSVKSKEAIENAKIYKAVNGGVLKNLQDAGSAVRELTGYITKQSHDRAKIIAAGFEKWFSDVVDKLDTEKTFGPGASTPQIKKALSEVYRQIATGQYDLPSLEQPSEKIGQNLSKATSYQRILHFKDGESWHEYNQEYGSKNLLESVISNINGSSRRSALMYKFGTNPEKAFSELKATLQHVYRDDPKTLAKFQQNEYYLDRWFDTAKGLSSVPGTSLAARAGQNARALVSISRLGSSIFTAFNHLTGAVTTLRSATGKNLLQSGSDLVGKYLESFTSSAERQKWAQRLGVFIDDLHGEIYSQMGAESAGPGTMSKMQRLFGKLSLLDQHISASKIAMAKQVAMDLADRVSTPFERLDPRFRAEMDRYGISAENWEHLGKAVDHLPDGTSAVTLEGLKQVNDSTRFDTESKFLSYINEHASISGMTPGLRQRAFLLRGMPDEGLGILARMVAQFKTVPMMALDNFSRVAMSNPETRPTNLRQAILQGKGDMQGMLAYSVMATTIGYVGLSAKEAASGRTPPDPTSLKTAQDAIVKGGAMGLMGDFLMGEASKTRTAADAALGPVLGQGAGLLDLWAKMRSGDKVGGEAFRQLMNNVPFHNLFYAKGALEYLFSNQVNEALNPGYLRRLENRVNKGGQDYFMYRPTGGNR